MMNIRVASILFVASLVSGCASMTGVQEHYLICPYDTLWDVSLDTLKDRPLVTKDKAKGLIETDWTEVPVARTYGALNRNIANARDRTKVSVTLSKVDDVTKISLAEMRERWKFRGGSRLYGWDPADPSDEEIARVMQLFTKKLKERGCTLT